MRARSLAAVAVLIASFMGFSATVAGAKAPTPVVINAHPCAFAPVEFGPWEATGAINDSGSYVRTEANSSPPGATFLTVKTVREEFLFTSSLGTFTIHAEERAFAPGVWQVEPGGTGAYAGTSGHGVTAFSFSPVPCASTFALTGVASKVG